ncbi:MAG: hypothetical protein H7A47_13020 [Verrucomicrobiales bacterium]|nr:hypothetical protein [Verrucomicrobiales bacterium]
MLSNPRPRASARPSAIHPPRVLATLLAALFSFLTFARPAATDSGGPAARLTDDEWTIAGQRVSVTVDPGTLRLAVKTPNRAWLAEPSAPDDLAVTTTGKPQALTLAAAGRRAAEPYATGYTSGFKITLGDYPGGATPLDLELQILVTLDGPDEDLVIETLASDGETRIRELSWPGPWEPGSFDTTVVPFMQGMLLPKDWPEKAWLYDTLSFGRGLYMPWWGHQQEEAAVLTILETPADGGCRFEHPAGGPTRTALRWVNSLGRWACPRRARFCFFDQGNHVTLAKRYRQHVIDRGDFVSLTTKIARNPRVGRLVGSPVIHTSILYHIQPESSYFHQDDPAANHQLVTFADRASQLEQLAARGIAQAYVHLDGWGARGYDNLHPDVLPPCPEAGGWEGMKHFGEVCERLSFVFAIHDQYRDFYLDAASYDPRHTLLDAAGHRPTGSTWYGGRQSILCSRLAPGYVRRNQRALRDHEIPLRGAYLDVFSVVPPDECYAPEHPVTRTECLRYRAESLDSVRSWGGVVSSEEPSDWSIPHLDLVHHGPYALRPNPGHGPAMGIPVPLFNLVYHDALLIPWSLGKGAWGIPENDLGFLHGLGNAGLPYLSLNPDEEELRRVRQMAALHRRVGLLEMTDHRFLDATHRRQEFAYADGTRVTIDLAADTFEVSPDLSE